MTVFKTTLLAATALTFLTGAALAGDNNRTFVFQGDAVGSGATVRNNGAFITQQGGDNQAGSEANYMLQNGRDSNISIDQSGDENLVGVSGRGVEQYGALNALGVIQSSNSNEVGQVIQEGTLGGNETRNRLNIIQQGSGENKVLDVLQRKSEYGNENRSSVTQNGSKNIVWQIEQKGAGNTSTLDQSGTGNYIYEIQVGKNNTDIVTQTGTDNTADIKAVGNANETTVVQYGQGGDAYVTSGDTGLASNNNVVRIDQGVNGTGDKAYIGLYGSDRNNVDLRQDGANDTQVQLSGGRENQLYIDQNFGGSALTSTATVEGKNSSYNTLEARQLKNSKLTLTLNNANSNGVYSYQNGQSIAVVNLDGSSYNKVGLTQVGDHTATINATDGADRNTVAALQFGGSGNASTITIKGGDSNLLATIQNGTGNRVDAMLTGSYNNSDANSASFSGTQAEFAANSLGLSPIRGIVYQEGSGNQVDLNVKGSYNAFQTVQSGKGNQIDGSIGGNRNTAFVAQVSGGNVATFVQNGNGNSLGVVQGTVARPAL
ncbi:hypothetical protein NS365_03155 [Aureimonas ureilytica]|uniref:Curlin n=1 Tax=Aureimonas ureilytica TaxID=401562 RepID=A0A175RV54_9HYPH|nr:hypothetical protein [Aureimonas ureilytica]KTR07590.1 hypothetical protein NS365_03155 [Aureimonas ureilytica]